MTIRKKYCVANFKMNKNRQESIKYIQTLYNSIFNDGFVGNGEKLRMIICPPFHSLDAIDVRSTSDTGIYVGAQNVSHYENGAYTGEISAEMLNRTDYVIIGHSERRNYFNESDDIINKKIEISLNNFLSPIFCIGETFDQRRHHLVEQTLRKQIKIGLKNIKNQIENDDSIDCSDLEIILAYEPVWAIGTGETATSIIIQETHKMIRNILNDIGFDGQKISILYGGSVNRSNAKELISLSDVDGFLIGGASLDLEHFYEIYKFIEESA